VPASLRERYGWRVRFFEREEVNDDRVTLGPQVCHKGAASRTHGAIDVGACAGSNRDQHPLYSLLDVGNKLSHQVSLTVVGVVRFNNKLFP
jgi:hypothetical protein